MLESRSHVDITCSGHRQDIGSRLWLILESNSTDNTTRCLHKQDRIIILPRALRPKGRGRVI